VGLLVEGNMQKRVIRHKIISKNEK